MEWDIFSAFSQKIELKYFHLLFIQICFAEYFASIWRFKRQRLRLYEARFESYVEL